VTRWRSRASLAIAVACAACGGERPGSSPGRSDVLFVVVDTLRADHLGCYGYARDTSPAIDELAREAVLFERAYASASWTKPSVASMITGLYPGRHGVVRLDHVVSAATPTLAERLRGAGYATAAVVSQRLIGSRFGYERGYEHFSEEEAGGHRNVSTRGVTKEALRLLGELRGEERPFFLFVHYFDPHTAYQRHREHAFAGPGAGRLRGGEPAPVLRSLDPPLSDEEISFLRAVYDEEIRSTDAGIGELVSWLADAGGLDRTLVVLAGDHGEELVERGRLGHTETLYEEIVHVPLIVRPPLYTGGGRRVAAPVSLVALPATILELIGLEADGSAFDEPSLGPLLDDPDAGSGGRVVHASVDYDFGRETANTPRLSRKRAVIGERYKLVHDREAKTFALYDLALDPMELEDVSAERADTLRALRALLPRDAEPALAPRTALSSQELEQLRGLGYVAPTE